MISWSTLKLSKNHIYLDLQIILFYEDQIKIEFCLLFFLIMADTSIKE